MRVGREKIFTPLPEVDEQSSRIKVAVNSLALPVGLEPSWIGIDIPVFERAASLAGTHIAVIQGENGEQDEVQVAGSMGDDGSLANSAAGLAKKQRGSFESFSIGDGDLNDFATILKLNNAARRADSGDIANQYDPYVQADLLDKSIRKQLIQMSLKSNLNRKKHVLDVVMDCNNAIVASSLVAGDGLQTSSSKLVLGLWTANQALRGILRMQKHEASGIEPQHSFFSITR
jgi:hypothetical protein